MKQAIIPIGNSFGIIIPREILESTGLKPGTKVSVEKDPNGKTIHLSPGGVKYTTSITSDFIRIVENVNRKYGAAFRELANK